MNSNPNGVASGFGRRAATPLGLLVSGYVSQGSSFLATLGFAPETLWDSQFTTARLEFFATFKPKTTIADKALAHAAAYFFKSSK